MFIFQERNSPTRGKNGLQRDEKAAGWVFLSPAGLLAEEQEWGLIIPVWLALWNEQMNPWVLYVVQRVYLMLENLYALQTVLKNNWTSVFQNCSWILNGHTFEAHRLKWSKSFTVISFLAFVLRCKVLYVTKNISLFIWRENCTFGFSSNLLETDYPCFCLLAQLCNLPSFFIGENTSSVLGSPFAFYDFHSLLTK